MVGSGLTAVYFLLLVNRAFFGRLAIIPPVDALSDARRDVRLLPVAPRETIPATGLALLVVVLGLVPALLGRLSETAGAGLARLPALAGGLASAGGL
jgi:NAD(P)H-quinone oxidoreductase subunit 4